MKSEEVGSVILIPHGSAVLALTLDEFERAKGRTAAVLSSGVQAGLGSEGKASASQERILSAKEISLITGIPATWFLEKARQQKIPHISFGKYVRFQMKAVLEYLKEQGRI